MEGGGKESSGDVGGERGKLEFRISAAARDVVEGKGKAALPWSPMFKVVRWPGLCPRMPWGRSVSSR